MRWLLILGFCLCSPALRAEPVFQLDGAASTVSFIARGESFSVTGTMPVVAGAALVDLGNLRASDIDVIVSTRAVKTGFLLATTAIKSADLLDVAQHPQIRFSANSISRRGGRARVSGDLTVKGITRPVALQAVFFRTAETDAETLPRIGVRLRGRTDRHAFGVSGSRGLIGPEIDIDITAWFDRVDG